MKRLCFVLALLIATARLLEAQTVTVRATDPSTGASVNVGDGTNNAFRINCVTGCAGGTSDTDDGSVAGGQVTGIGISMAHVWDGSVWRRFTIGTAGSPSSQVLTVQGITSMTALKVDGSAVTQPVSGTFWQATQPVSLASVPSHAVTNAGTFAVQATQSGTWTVTGAGGTFPVTGALTDTQLRATAVVVDGSGVTQPVSGTVTANLGTIGSAATAAKQDTGNTSLASIDTKVPALGQALAAASVPIVLTAAQLTTLTPPAAITGYATSANQTTELSSLASIDGKITAVNTGAVVVSSSALPSGAATSTKQSDGSQKTQIVDGSGNVIGSTSNALDINIKSGNPTTIAVTNTGTFATQSAITAASGALGSGSIASGAIASGAYASGSIGSGAIASGAVASGAYASGSISDGAVVTLGAKADAKSTATDTTAITAMQVLKEISFMAQNPAALPNNQSVNVAQVNGATPAGIAQLGTYTFGTKTTLTTTNFSNLASGSGWQSAAITTSGVRDIIFRFVTKGAAGSTSVVNFYIAPTISSDTTYVDGATGSEGTYTASGRLNARFLCAVLLNTTTAVQGSCTLSDVYTTIPGKFAIIAVNNSGGTISSTGGDTVFDYETVK